MSLIDNLLRQTSDYQELARLLDHALAEIDRLRLEVAMLRSENRQLRRKLADRELRLLRRAERDAMLIGALHVAGGYTSKRACRSVGLTENRWVLARCILRFGGALSRRSGRYKVETGEGFEQAIAAGVRLVEAEGIEVLMRSSYRHRRKM